MFFTYLRRELTNRKRQTFIVSLGLALAIAVVLVVSALSAGAKDAQKQVLGSLYGIGTDVTVTQTAQPGQGGGPQQFNVPGGQSGSADTSAQRQVNRTNLRLERGVSTFDATAVQTVTAVPDVADVATSLRLSNTTFTGELPQAQQGQTPGASNFSVDSSTVMGIGTDDTTGPLSGTAVTDGRGLAASDAGQFNAVLDSTYANSESLTVGNTITLGKTDGTQDFTVVGLLSSSTSAAETASNVYIPLDIAQTLSGQAGLVSNIYVAASSGSATNAVADGIKAALPNATVSTTSDLGSTVSGSLSTATDMLGNLGKWLSILVLGAAFLLAVLFTVSGVTRRTREFGTLRALGWRKNRIVGQVAGESIVQGLLGGGIGLLVAFIAVRIIDTVAPTLEASTGGLSTAAFPGGLPGGQGGTGGPQGTGSTIADAARAAGGARPGGAPTGTTFQVALKTAMSPTIIFAAIGLAVLGGLLAGAFGGLRASRLRPADALRSVA